MLHAMTWGFYEGIISLGFFCVFAFLDRKPRFYGFYTGLWAFCYGISRFMLDTLRYPDIDARYFGFTPAQYGSVILVFIGIWVLMTRRNSDSLQNSHTQIHFFSPELITNDLPMHKYLSIINLTFRFDPIPACEGHTNE